MPTLRHHKMLYKFTIASNLSDGTFSYSWTIIECHIKGLCKYIYVCLIYANLVMGSHSIACVGEIF